VKNENSQLKTNSFRTWVFDKNIKIDQSYDAVEEELCYNWNASLALTKSSKQGTGFSARQNNFNKGNNSRQNQNSNKKFQKPKTKTNYHCAICDVTGHSTERCWYNAKGPNFHPDRATKSANVAGTKKKEEETSSFSFVASHTPSTVWIMDSGASNHMTGDKSLFTTLESTNQIDPIQIANGKTVQVKGEGTVTLQVRDIDGDDLTITMENVLYIPDLKPNLLSVKEILN